MFEWNRKLCWSHFVITKAILNVWHILDIDRIGAIVHSLHDHGGMSQEAVGQGIRPRSGRLSTPVGHLPELIVLIQI